MYKKLSGEARSVLTNAFGKGDVLRTYKERFDVFGSRQHLLHSIFPSDVAKVEAIEMFQKHKIDIFNLISELNVWKRCDVASYKSGKLHKSFADLGLYLKMFGNEKLSNTVMPNFKIASSSSSPKQQHSWMPNLQSQHGSVSKCKLALTDSPDRKSVV